MLVILIIKNEMSDQVKKPMSKTPKSQTKIKISIAYITMTK